MSNIVDWVYATFDVCERVDLMKSIRLESLMKKIRGKAQWRGSANSAGLKSKIQLDPRRSIGARLFLYFFAVILIVVSVVGGVSYWQSLRLIEGQVTDSKEMTAQQAGEKLEMVLAKYEDVAFQISVAQELREIERTYLRNEKDVLGQLDARTNLTAILNAPTYSDDAIAGISLYPADPDSNLPALTTFNMPMQYPEETPWFQKALELDGRGFWVATEPLGPSGLSYEPALGYARLVRSPNTMTPLYVLIIEVKESLIQNVVGNALGDGGSVYLLDEEGRILSSPQQEDITTVFGLGFDHIQAGGVHPLEGEAQLVVHSSLEKMGWHLVGTQPFAPLVAGANQILILTILMIFLGAVLAVLIGILMARRIGGPIQHISVLMARAENGDLTVEAPHRERKDEIGLLANSFQSMVSHIRSLVKETHQSVEEVLKTAAELGEASRRTANSAKEIAVATEQIAMGSSNVASEAERVTDVAGTLGERMEETVQAYEQMAVAADDVRKSSEQGTSYMKNLSEKTSETEQLTQSMIRKVEDLQKSTDSIRDILAMLDDIAKQTNILSLNATIEAARAGEAGRGFMVVADEIRKLADQSKQSIGTVGEITNRIRTEIEETVQLMEQAHPMFQEQIASVKESNEIFISVNDRMNDFVKQLDSISEAVQQLEATQQTLSEAMTSVSAVAQQSSAATEEVASLSTEQLHVGDALVGLAGRLNHVSQRLKETINKFQL